MPKARTFGSIRPVKTGHQARYSHEGEQRTLGTFATVKEAEEALVLKQAEILKGEHIDLNKGSITFADFAVQAMAHRKTKLKPGTISNDLTNLKMRLLPTFGHKPLKNIRKSHVYAWYDSLADKPNVQKNSYFTLAAILSHAVELDEIKEVPRVKGANKMTAQKPKVFSVQDFKNVVDAAPEDFRVVLWTMFASHARLGELCGLTRGDVDLDAKTILIERQAKGERITTTKTGNSRKVVLLDKGVDELTPYLKKNLKMPSAPLFTAPRGGRMNQSHFYKVWDAATVKAGLPEMVPHSIRHISLAFCGHSGMTLEEVLQRAGHSDPKMSLHYMSSNEERRTEAAATASARLMEKLSAVG